MSFDSLFIFRRQYDKKADKMTLFFQTISSAGVISNDLKELTGKVLVFNFWFIVQTNGNKFKEFLLGLIAKLIIKNKKPIPSKTV